MRRHLIFWVGAAAYLVAVTQRTTIGVAGVAATERFDTSASALSMLAVVQLIVYAGAQVPVGMLIDRFGPRRLTIAGLSLMAAGQLLVAFAPSIALAAGGRVLVGAGDAALFTSIIRLVNSWYSGRRVPLLTQWVGNIGQLGQIVSAVPFAFLLHQSGWSVAFVSAASLAIVALVAVTLVVRDQPAEAMRLPLPTTGSTPVARVRASLSRPGTRLGFWAHFVTQSSGTVFTLLWGVPFLVYGLGYPPELASGLLTVIVLAGVVCGALFGILSARYPFRRSYLVLAIVVFLAVAWGAVLLWPGVPPFWLIIVLLVAIGAGGPGSLVGFDFARMANPLHSLGSANGIVNVGGFLAGFVMMVLVGVVLDLQHTVRLANGGADELYTLDAFRWAFAVQYLVVGAGVVFLLRARRQTRRRLAEDEGIEVGPLWVALVRAWRSRGRAD